MAKLIKQLVKAIKAAGDEKRIMILMLLNKREELCVCEIQALLNLSQPTVSRHLKILEDVGFLESHREGQWVIYRLKKNWPFISYFFKGIETALANDEEFKSLIVKAKKISLRH